jgi:hypothetical protein
MSTKAAALIAAAVCGVVGVRNAPAAIITQWNFSGVTTGTVIDDPAPTTGNGSSLSLGMTNSYAYSNGEGPGAVDGSNYTNVASAADKSFSENTWRIVGNNNNKNAGAGKADGWNNSAPNGTQGAEFLASTVGFTGVNVGFDWYCTTQGVGNLQVEYTLDGGSTWTPIGTDFVATANDFYGATATGVTVPNISIDLSSIPGASDDAGFGIEMVSVRPVSTDANYNSAFATNGDYAAASSTAATPVVYNNSSGNWSFSNITVSGTAVPEPASLGALGLAGMALLNGRRRNKTV